MEKDLLVIGGGINGVGIAADAAGRGLSVTLCEMADLASGTSSASSKLIHGGLRYLENGDFGLVRESLQERKILQRLAPHLIKPQAFVMPHCPRLRPYWMIRLGLFMYDYLFYDRHMPKSRSLPKAEIAQLHLQPQYNQALQYYDCTSDDSRLVVSVALLARQHGAEIMTHTKLVKAIRKQDGWLVTLLHKQDLKVLHVKAIVNAAGPWVQQVATEILQTSPKLTLNLVKGSHIIVPRLFKHDKAFILQNSDGRIVFVIPYMHDFTLIGTTEVVLKEIEQPVTVTPQEIQYLCAVTNKFLQQQITPADVLHQYAGIRALHDTQESQAQKMTRDYALDINDAEANSPLISIYGGKITTYRSLSEHVGNLLCKYFPQAGKAWTHNAYLPGGYIAHGDIQTFKQRLCKTYAQLPETLISHYLDTYGTRTTELLLNVHSISDLGLHFGANLYQREVDFLIRNEWATSATDILWRRGKEGLWFNQDQTKNLENYLTSRTSSKLA